METINEEIELPRCVKTETMVTVPPEQLRLQIVSHRKVAVEARRSILTAARLLEREIAAYDLLLAELTIN